MAITKETGLGLDSNRLISLAISISPDRDRYFNDMIRKFREKFPGLKLIYANDRMGAQLNPEHPQPDFVIIAKGNLVSNDPRLPPKSIIFSLSSLSESKNLSISFSGIIFKNLSGEILLNKILAIFSFGSL